MSVTENIEETASGKLVEGIHALKRSLNDSQPPRTCGVALTCRLSELADERRKLLHAYFANALPLELLKEDRTGSRPKKIPPGPSWRPLKPISASGRKR